MRDLATDMYDSKELLKCNAANKQVSYGRKVFESSETKQNLLWYS